MWEAAVERMPAPTLLPPSLPFALSPGHGHLSHQLPQSLNHTARWMTGNTSHYSGLTYPSHCPREALHLSDWLSLVWLPRGARSSAVSDTLLVSSGSSCCHTVGWASSPW